jgi:hypothetical protein
MTFLQPWMLAALPLASLPIIIHLINQRRFQTVQWGAMMFLLSAKALSSGYSKLRNWLILFLRMLAVAAVILAVGRPLSRGWLALAGGGRPDTAILVLDRSPSMQARDPAVEGTKLATGRRQLAESLALLAPSRCLLVTDPETGLVEIDPRSLAELPSAGPVAAAADIPALLQAAYEHLRANAAGTAEIWICSDERSNDWAIDDGSWAGLRDAFAKLPQQVRFQLLSFAAPEPDNLAVRVTEARLDQRGRDRELVVSLVVSRPDGGEAGAGPVTVPVRFELDGVSSVVDLELTGREAVLANHVLPLDRSTPPRGWGRVTIPPDPNLADNEFFFTFDAAPPRVALVVAQESAAARVLGLAASIAPAKDLVARAEMVAASGLATAPWEEAAVLLWQGPLPAGDDATLVEAFIARGGQAIFFPPETADATAFAGLSWGPWTVHPTALRPEQWRTDDGLLANTLSGGALPLGDLEVRRSCGLAGEQVPLATLAGGGPLVARAGDSQGVFFCTTLPLSRDSTLASEGVVLYALLQRAIDRGLEALSGARQLDAGPATAALAAADSAAGWRRLAGSDEALSSEAGLHAGVYADGDRLLAVNRPAAEDAGRAMAAERIDGLFRGLSVARITGRAGASDSLVQEIWRAFLIAMLLALILEGLLSLPRRRQPSPALAPSLEAAA